MLVEVQHTSGPGPDSCMPYIVDICGPLTPAMSDATDTSLHVSIPTELLRPTPTVLTPMPVVPQESVSPSNCIYDWNQDISSMFPSLPTTNPSIKPTPKRLLTSDDVIHQKKLSLEIKKWKKYRSRKTAGSKKPRGFWKTKGKPWLRNKN